MTTSIQKQFSELKVKHPDAMLLFRCGDFYETYHEDAENASKVLGITLTTTDGNTRLAAFPHHALDTYLPKLIRAGYRVAICDQLEDPRMTKTLVKRGVTELDAPRKQSKPRKPSRVKLPSLTKKQYELLCECIRYRVADNQKERQDAFSRGHFTKWYEDLNTQLTELKDIIYNLK